MNIFITLDYELFLGKDTGSVLNCLIRPMEELNMISKRYKVFYTIFVDSAYLLRLNELKSQNLELQNDWEAVEHNIKELCVLGHDIEYHFHPQWLYSTYNTEKKKWELDYKHYKMSDMKFCTLVDSFTKAKHLLERIVGRRIVSFRAGGYCLEGVDYAKLFKENEIKIDSSVARKAYCNTSTHNYDYRKIPDDIIYSFSNDVHKRGRERDEFVELSISSMKWPLFTYLWYFRSKFRSYRPKNVYKDGEPIRDKGKNTVVQKIINKLNGTTTLCSIDGPFSLFLEDYYDYALKNNSKDLVLIGHPKNTTDVSIINLEKFIMMHRKDSFRTSVSLINNRY